MEKAKTQRSAPPDPGPEQHALRRLIIIISVVACLSACSGPKTFDSASVYVAARTAAAHPSSAARSHPPAAVHSRAFHRWMLHLWFAKWLAALRSVEHYDWDAVARCETGGNWGMVGSVYSTGLGMMNAAIRENSPPDAAAAELAGIASRAQIVATAERIAARHGIGSWGCAEVA